MRTEHVFIIVMALRKVRLARVCLLPAIALCELVMPGSVLANDLHLRSGIIRLPDGRFSGVSPDKLYIIQFPNPITASTRAQTERIGLLVHGYQHKNALVVRSKKAVTLQEVRSTGASGTVPLPAEAKIERRLLQLGPGQKIKVHVMLWSRDSRAFDVMGQYTRITNIVVSQYAQAQAEVNKSLLARIAANPDVMWIEPVSKFSLLNDDHRYSTQAMRVLSAPWCGGWPNSYSLSGDKVKLAQFDGGAIDNHVGFLDQLNNARFTNITTAAIDGHATFVAGTIFGNGASSPNGLFELAGMAPKAQLFGGDCWTNPSAQQAALIASDGVVATNHSWGWMSGHYDQSSLQFDSMVHSTNRATVFGAGNEGVDQVSWNTPIYASLRSTAQAKNIITVGGLQELNSVLRWINSSVGPTVDVGTMTRAKPDLMAISQRVASTTGTSTFGTSGGTSFAAPAVTGAIGLLAERYIYFKGNIAGFKADVAKAILLASADDLGSPGPDYETGYGRLNVYHAVKILDGGLDPKLPPNVFQNPATPKYFTWIVGSVGSGQTVKLTLNVGLQPNTTTPIQDDVKITCVWTDPPPVGTSSLLLVNDLDLSLKDKYGAIHLPYTLTPGSPSAPAKTNVKNSVDNVEQVARRLGLGSHTVIVQGTNVPYGPQRFVIAVWAPTLDVQIKVSPMNPSI